MCRICNPNKNFTFSAAEEIKSLNFMPQVRKSKYPFELKAKMLRLHFKDYYSRKTLSKHFKIPYSTVCHFIRQIKNEVRNNLTKPIFN